MMEIPLQSLKYNPFSFVEFNKLSNFYTSIENGFNSLETTSIIEYQSRNLELKENQNINTFLLSWTKFVHFSHFILSNTSNKNVFLISANCYGSIDNIRKYYHISLNNSLLNLNLVFDFEVLYWNISNVTYTNE